MKRTAQNCQARENGPLKDGRIRLTAGCKINLYLTITGLRQQPPHVGWHELDTVFVPLPEPCDTLLVGPGRKPGFSLVCEEPGIDLANNTLTRAYAAFAAAVGNGWTPPALEVELIKSIPHGAGLGGGSADAATLLLWLNSLLGVQPGRAEEALAEQRGKMPGPLQHVGPTGRRWATMAGQGAAPAPLTVKQLAAVALSVGADVPFFLYNRPCRATGLGDHLEPVELPFLEGWHLVLVMPAVHVSTPWAFRAFDEAMNLGEGRKNFTNPKEGLTGGAQFAISSFARAEPIRLENDFEKIVFRSHEGLARHKAFLLQAGAAAAVMSGSGSSIYGLFREAGQAFEAVQRLRTSGVKCTLHSFTTAR